MLPLLFPIKERDRRISFWTAFRETPAMGKNNNEGKGVNLLMKAHFIKHVPEPIDFSLPTPH
jgi:hypothetical protein